MEYAKMDRNIGFRDKRQFCEKIGIVWTPMAQSWKIRAEKVIDSLKICDYCKLDF
jgi:hypothetical protein